MEVSQSASLKQKQSTVDLAPEPGAGLRVALLPLLGRTAPVSQVRHRGAGYRATPHPLCSLWSSVLSFQTQNMNSSGKDFCLDSSWYGNQRKSHRASSLV